MRLPIRAMSSLRPAWWPPPCPNCKGFPYIMTEESRARRSREQEQRNDGTGYASRLKQHGDYEPCPACLAHPGHAMSHDEWNRMRA